MSVNGKDPVGRLTVSGRCDQWATALNSNLFIFLFLSPVGFGHLALRLQTDVEQNVGTEGENWQEGRNYSYQIDNFFFSC